MSDVLVHVYGAIPASARLPGGLTGRLGRPIRLVGDDRLAVLVSDVDDDSRVRREDLLVHAHLLETVAEETTVIPTRFGVLVPDDDTVRREFLAHQRDHLLALLEAFDGCVQLTVHATYDEEEALREVLRRDPGLAAARESVDLSDTAAQLRLGEAVSRALTSLRETAADLVVDRLRPHALATSLNEVRGAFDVVSVALLVRRDDRAGLDAVVGDLKRQLSGQISVRYVGPQPPYAFLDHVVTGERSWA
ncbi:MAG: GvpL/GvpF family gas vesicle protein [Propionibacteriales bacterium]|nr:GvpL/GvpF family gas vesicle protein [Propionibacteriales bacterium]